MMYIVRKNCEYSMRIEAESEEEAVLKSETVPLDEWIQAWSTTETEPESVSASEQSTKG